MSLFRSKRLVFLLLACVTAGLVFIVSKNSNASPLSDEVDTRGAHGRADQQGLDLADLQVSQKKETGAPAHPNKPDHHSTNEEPITPEQKQKEPAGKEQEPVNPEGEGDKLTAGLPEEPIVPDEPPPPPPPPPKKQQPPPKKTEVKPKPAHKETKVKPVAKNPKLHQVPTPVLRNAHKYQSDGNDGCWKGGPRDFTKRPVVVYQQGASGEMSQPPFDMCDVPCFLTGNGGMMNRADVFPAWEGMAGTGQCTDYQKTSWITMENYEHRSPPGASYRSTVSLSSEVPVPYLSWFDFDPLKPMMRYNKTGTAMATAFVSNCGASERRAYIEALMSHGITVHSFGGCLHNKNEEEVSSVSGKYERKMDIMSKYLFHLSFENSRTPDYVTEKFFQSLEAGVVPVYFGAPNIEDFEPAPNTILHVDDFSGPEALATEMKRLANDRDAYLKMLEWKKTGVSNKFKALFDLNTVHSQCRLCLRTGDDFVKQFGEVNDHISPEHASVPRDQFHHILVRERNTFYFQVVPLDESDLTLSGLHGAILQTFSGYTPVFARHEKLVKLRNYNGKFLIHRVYPAFISVHDTMYGPQALKTDADVAALKKGDKMEVIFLEDNE